MSFLNSAGFRVGILVVGASALIAYMSMELSQNTSFLNGDSRVYWFVTETADGLIRNGQVKMAGIPVGVIKNISLQDGMARVDIAVEADIPIRESAVAELKASGVLGDRHVELDPGYASDPPLPNGARIREVRSAGSLGKVLDQVSQVAESIKVTTDALALAVKGDGDRDDVIGRILLNVEKLTGELSEVTVQNRDDVRQIIGDLSAITKSVNEVVQGDDGQGLKEGWGKLMASLDRLEKTSQNLEEITEKVNAGEGTIGRLINDESTVDEINLAVENVNSFLGGAARIETSLDFGSDYFTEVDQFRTYVGVKVQPGSDRYYLVQLIDDATGVTDLTETRSSQDGGAESVRRVERTDYSETKLTALFAKNFYDLTIKGGLYESSGGFGFDYGFFRNTISAEVMAFNFESTNIRASLNVQPFKGFFIRGGVNDLLDNSGNFSSFYGAGILLTNDDLKLLLTGSAL